MGIVFNSRVGLQAFTEPAQFPTFLPVFPGAGLYVVLVSDPSWGPRQYRPIYFGETSDFSQRVTRDHEHFGDWQRCVKQLYIGRLSMSAGSTKQQRLDVESALIDWYRPECNRTGLAAL